MVDSLSLFFGKKRRSVRKSPGRKPGRGRGVRKLSKSQAYVLVGKRKRKLHRGANGGLYYRTKSGRHYVPSAVLRRKKHALSPKRRRKGRKGRKGRKSRKSHRGGRRSRGRRSRGRRSRGRRSRGRRSRSRSRSRRH